MLTASPGNLVSRPIPLLSPGPWAEPSGYYSPGWGGLYVSPSGAEFFAQP